MAKTQPNTEKTPMATSAPTAKKSGPSRIGLFPGTFDPFTNGHLDVIRRGRMLFDQLIVAVGRNPAKRALFTTQERIEMIEAVLRDEKIDNATVKTYDILTADYAGQVGATAILRGLRNSTDLHHEFQLALTNRAVADIETVFIMTGDAYSFTSSSLIKQIAIGGEISRLHRLLPATVIERLKAKKNTLGEKFRHHHIDGFAD